MEVGLNDEQTVVVEVGDNDLPVTREADTTGRGEVLGEGALEAIFVEEGAVRRKQLHAPVASVRHDDAARAIITDRHVPGVVELTVLAASLAKLGQKLYSNNDELTTCYKVLLHRRINK